LCEFVFHFSVRAVKFFLTPISGNKIKWKLQNVDLENLGGETQVEAWVSAPEPLRRFSKPIFLHCLDISLKTEVPKNLSWANSPVSASDCCQVFSLLSPRVFVSGNPP
jgi:hypothetical protein